MPDLYVEKSTSMIYECKFFDTFVLVRPATPMLYLAIKKISHNEFMDDFEEFGGCPDEARDFLRGNKTPAFILDGKVSRKT
jgi:hypothetical protein